MPDSDYGIAITVICYTRMRPGKNLMQLYTLRAFDVFIRILAFLCTHAHEINEPDGVVGWVNIEKIGIIASGGVTQSGPVTRKLNVTFAHLTALSPSSCLRGFLKRLSHFLLTPPITFRS
jgi:hypothetical protein